MPVVGYFSEFFKTPEKFSLLFDWTKHPKYPKVHDLKSYWLDQFESDPEMAKLISQPQDQVEEPQAVLAEGAPASSEDSAAEDCRLP